MAIASLILEVDRGARSGAGEPGLIEEPEMDGKPEVDG